MFFCMILATIISIHFLISVMSSSIGKNFCRGILTAFTKLSDKWVVVILFSDSLAKAQSIILFSRSVLWWHAFIIVPGYAISRWIGRWNTKTCITRFVLLLHTTEQILQNLVHLCLYRLHSPQIPESQCARFHLVP